MPDADNLKTLLNKAEARIDTALAQLVLTTKGVADSTAAQAIAIAELRAARKAINALREQIDRRP